MKILGIYTSPRKGGNTDILLDIALRSASEAGAEVSRIYARDLIIPPCTGCASCDRTGHCFMRDDFDSVIEQIESADALIFATPIHFYTISAHAMSIVNRAQSGYARRYIMKDENVIGKPLKPAALISAGGTNGKKLFDGVRLTMYYFFYAAGYKLRHELLVPGIDGKGEVLDKPEAVEQAKEIGRKLAAPEPEPPDDSGDDGVDTTLVMN